jgi:ParB family chromosome partitioning protein
MMARRKRIEAPSAEELARIDEEGRVARPSGLAPIAQVAGEAAALGSALDPEAEAERLEAATLRRLRREGWEVRAIPMARVRTDGMTRDRMVLDPDAMEELRSSIRTNGLRMPIEVSQRNRADGEGEYDLISGLRRLTAMRDLEGPAGAIRALSRPEQAPAARLGAMIEENEVRANLSSYERGRAAALAVQDGLFRDLDEAVNVLFAQASKAKRSKVRSFALLHEELGDLLAFPEALSERQCLRLAAALKAGQGSRLRTALGGAPGADAAAEWALLQAAFQPDVTVDRPAEPTQRRRRRAAVPLPGDRFMRHVVDASGHAIGFGGPGVDDALIEAVMEEIGRVLDRAENESSG